MKKIMLSLAALVLLSGVLAAQTYNGDNYRRGVRPTKNVIVMIPDGTSIGMVSAARWYKVYNGLGNNLAIDPYFCGTVQTFCSNAPIGDSAPTTSAYMTGMPQQAGNVAIYPQAHENDLVDVDPSMAYRPLATILEAMRIEQDKATGLVVTVEFPHATPADCSAHHYDRGRYDQISSQMAYQNLDVMFGGGASIVTDDMEKHFAVNGTTYLDNNIEAFRSHKQGRVWALWNDMSMPYAIDRDTAKIPSLCEMTSKAIELLSQDENGFFLMVEGSKIDWLAHANDAGGCITEFLEFDKAVGAVMDFAVRDGNTTVVILPDHGNSGFTIGRRDMNSYSRSGLERLFGAVSKYQRTAEGLEKILLGQHPEAFRAIIKQYTDIDITDEEFEDLVNSKNYKPEDYTKVSDGRNMTSKLVDIMNKRTWFGFTTGGHTGEEVFLAAYHPQGDIPTGMNTNIDINHYLADAAGLRKRLPDITTDIFAKHTDVFAGMNCSVDKTDSVFPVLVVKKGRKTLRIPAFKSVAYIDGKAFDTGSVAVYVDKNETFYLPGSLAERIR